MFETYSPSIILQPYIAFFYTIKCHRSDYKNSISEFCMPSGYAHMGFHLRGLFYVVQNNKKQKLSRYYAVGQQTERYYINSDSNDVEFYGVTFQPTGLWHLFKPNMPLITNKAVATNSVLSCNLNEFTENFEAEQSTKSRIQLIENIFTERLSSTQPQQNVIDSAFQLIKENYGCCSIKSLIGQLGISERYLEKKFKTMVGITPTTYKRIVRFNFMLAEIKADTITDYQLLSALFNYYDFPHFSNDFKKYCGVSPSKFQVDRFDFLQEVMASKALLNRNQQNPS
ncbi:helix-turn-helix domain-containing protein [Gelidibacter gilvus]|uniref:AraC family transcriptional regulator n=1 Tax=Gelidibacter gilvus TaxID=59602 RepID=A0A4Q0XCY3_9FLAO|nr:AraC family transcriptional regulator [Gelidibacter gilvus]RXJ44456.1 AraC family transcriptional regulator [Gelidibacter gilvus]